MRGIHGMEWELIYEMGEIFVGKLKHRKPPAMPYWWWLGQDGCWFCKNKSACSNCGVIKKERKSWFSKKIKGERSANYKGKRKRFAYDDWGDFL